MCKSIKKNRITKGFNHCGQIKKVALVGSLARGTSSNHFALLFPFCAALRLPEYFLRIEPFGKFPAKHIEIV